MIEATISEICEEIRLARLENPDLEPLHVKDFLDRGVKLKLRENTLVKMLFTPKQLKPKVKDWQKRNYVNGV